jgi:hypothetical protein
MLLQFLTVQAGRFWCFRIIHSICKRLIFSRYYSIYPQLPLSSLSKLQSRQSPNRMGEQLVVFDFDWSFVDQDTDRWVFEVLSTPLRRKLQDRKSSGTGMQCTPDVVFVDL